MDAASSRVVADRRRRDRTGADIPPSLGTGVSPRRSARKLATKLLDSLPSGQRSRHMRPLDENLVNRLITRCPAPLQEAFMNLKCNKFRRQRRTDSLRTWRALEQRHMKDWVHCRCCWKVQEIGHSTNALQNAEGPKELE